MIDIDGSYGEGGGQILRTSISLAALTLKPIRVRDIRASRPQPGLKSQHLGAIELAARLVDATVKGLQVGSTEVTFQPKHRQAGEFDYDVGTAGSISLLLQAVLPPAVLAEAPITFRLRGGTDVNWSPPIDYLREVFVPVIARLGPMVEIQQIRRGHYPKGGGQVICRVSPVKSLTSIRAIEFGELEQVFGISHCVRLPQHIAERQAESARDVLNESLGKQTSIRVESYPKENDPHLSPGSGVVLWAKSTNGAVIGSDQLGEKGKRAEMIGNEVAAHLLKELSAGRALDSHMCDMLVPYLAIADGVSEVGVTEITSHLATNIWTIEQILGTKIELEGSIGKPGLLRVYGESLLS
jgi:RNA 3'-phosphate cyclase